MAQRSAKVLWYPSSSSSVWQSNALWPSAAASSISASVMVELGGIEPPSAGRCLSVIRPFPVCGVNGSCVAGSGGPRLGARHRVCSPEPAVFPAVSGLSLLSPPLLLPGCGGLAPRAVTGRGSSLGQNDQAARSSRSLPFSWLPRFASLSNSGRTAQPPVPTSKPISPVCTSCQGALP